MSLTKHAQRPVCFSEKDMLKNTPRALTTHILEYEAYTVALEQRTLDAEARVKDLEVNSYPHMCRDEHEQIGHRNSEIETCPLCEFRDALADMVEGQYPAIPRTATELTEIRQKALANAQKLLKGPL